MVRLSRLIVGVSLSAATFALPATAGAAGDEYVVIEGDTLVGIASEFGLPLRDLLAANGLTVRSVILPGQQLVVPEASSNAPATPGPSYTIVPGDTLSGIAQRAGVSFSALLEVNGMTATSLIMPGQDIRLPAGATAPSSPPAAATGTPVDTVLNYALAQVGKPYTFFTRGPAEFDCSGLTLEAYARIGVDLVHHSATQARQGTAVDFWNVSIKAGDLVFLDGDWNGEIDHVGIALGPTTWVHASESRDAVITSSLPSKSVIIAVRRFVD